MIEGWKIAAAFADAEGAALADALAGSLFLPEPTEDKAFEVTRADPSGRTVTVTRSNGVPLEAPVARGDIDPTPAFADAWSTYEHDRDVRSLRIAGVDMTLDAADVAVLLRCFRGTMPSVVEGKAAIELTRQRRAGRALKALCAHWISIGGPWPFALMREAAVALRDNNDFPEALDLLAAIEPGVAEGNRVILLSQWAALLMDMAEHCGDGAAFNRATDCIELLDRVKPGESDLLWKRWTRLTGTNR